MRYIRKALEKGYLENPRSACCTDNVLLRFWGFSRVCGALFVHFQAKRRHEQATHLRLSTEGYDCYKCHEQYSMQTWGGVKVTTFLSPGFWFLVSG